MSEQPTQEWRIDATMISGPGSGIWLNGEAFSSVTAIKFLACPGTLTQLTLTLVPHHVHIVTDPELYLVVGHRRFRVIEDAPGDLTDGLFGAR
jgi:hypothetical protein